MIRELHAADPRVKLIRLSRRFGQPAATMAGLRMCSGDACVVIDADMQDPPELIAEMVEAFQALGQRLLQDAAPGVADDFVGAYGAEPATLWAEVLRQLGLRLRSIGLSDLSEAGGPAPRRLDPAS